MDFESKVAFQNSLISVLKNRFVPTIFITQGKCRTLDKVKSIFEFAFFVKNRVCVKAEEWRNGNNGTIFPCPVPNMVKSWLNCNSTCLWWFIAIHILNIQITYKILQ